MFRLLRWLLKDNPYVVSPRRLGVIQKDVNDQVRGKDTIHREESLAKLKEKMDSKHMEAQLNDNSEWKEEMEGALNVLSKVGDHVQSLLNPHTAHTDAVFGIVAVGAGSHNFVTSSWDGHVKLWRLNEDTASFELEREHELRDGSMTLAACMHKDYLGDSLECVGSERLDALVSGQFDGSTNASAVCRIGERMFGIVPQCDYAITIADRNPAFI